MEGSQRNKDNHQTIMQVLLPSKGRKKRREEEEKRKGEKRREDRRGEEKMRGWQEKVV